MSIALVMPSNHLILCRPLLLPPSIFPSNRVFSNEPVLRIRWTKYWSFSFSISPSNKYSGLISFRMDWLDLLAVQGTLESLLQHHSSKASVVWCSAFFIVQLTSIHDHWKNHSLDEMDLCWPSHVKPLHVQEAPSLLCSRVTPPCPPASCTFWSPTGGPRVQPPCQQCPPGRALIPGSIRVLTLGSAGGRCADVQLVCPHQRGW